MNPGEVLSRVATESPDRVAIVSDAEALRFGEWNARANAVAAWLAGKGIGRGSPVALVLPNGIEFPLLYLGIAKLGAVTLPIDPRLGEPELLALLDRSGARLVVVSPGFGSQAALGGRVETVTTADPELAPRLAGTIAAPDRSSDAAPDDPALYLHTSGTTGRARVVVLSFANLDCFPDAMGAVLGTSERDVTAMALPMSHISGPVVLNEILDKRSTLAIPGAPTPSGILAAITRHRVTWMHAVPPIAQGMLRALGEEHDLSSLRFLALMGTSVPVPVLRALKAACPRASIIQGYGLTETSPLLTLLPLADDERRIGSVGKAVPGAELRVVDAEGRESPAGEPGELIARGPMLMQGYLDDPEATAARIREGFLHTGDVMSRDETGYLFHLGRADDLIVTGRGLNVYPAEVENALLTHPAVHDVAVAGIETADGLVVKAWIVRSPGAEASETELRRHCGGRLASFKVPRRIAFVDGIPRNPMNKVLRAELDTPA